MKLAISAVNLKFGGRERVCCFNEVFDLYEKLIFTKAHDGKKLTEKLS
jgi:hypothetical protein